LIVGNYNGPLQANNGVVSATTSIGQLYGGTGITSYTAGDILYANSTGVLTKLPVGAEGLVLKVTSGLPSWQTDITSGGGGGATAWSTTTNSMAIYPTDTSDILILGTNATSTTGNILEVLGNSLFRGDVRITGNASSSLISANYAQFGGTGTTTIDSVGRITTAYSSSTAYSSFLNASTTNLFAGNFTLSTTTAGLLRTNANGITYVDTTAYSNFSFPYTINTGYNSTSTTIGFTGGLFSTASSTFSGALRLPSLSQGVAYIGSTGLVGTTATTTVSCSGSASCT
jgi:hypothetical protein